MVAVEMVRTEGLELAAPMVDLSSKPSFPEWTNRLPNSEEAQVKVN